MIITIGRDCGCDGDEVGKILADKLGIPCYNKDSLLTLARQKGLYEKYPYFFSEIPSDVYNMTDAGSTKKALAEPKEALNALIGENDCVVVGRCGNYALRNREDMISVFLTGNKDARIKNIARNHKVDEQKARNIVDKTDNRRREYHKYYTGELWGMEKYYDMVIREAEIGIDETVKIICDYIDSHK